MNGFTLASFIQGFSLLSFLFLLIGLALLVIEMFVPGFGAPGISGIAFLVFSVLSSSNTFVERVVYTIVIMALIAVFFCIFLYSATKGKFSKSPIVLNEEQGKQQGFISTKDLEFFVGKQGVALTNLHPSGMADFEGVKLDVVSNGEFIEKESEVEIKKVEGRRIVVDKK